MKMPLTMQQIVDLAAAIPAMDGWDKVVRDAAGREQVVRVPFVLGGAVRLTLARNMQALRPLIDAHSVARDGLIVELSGGKPAITDAATAAEFGRQMQTMAATVHDVDLHTVTEAGLQLDKNEFPIAALAALEPIIRPASTTAP